MGVSKTNRAAPIAAENPLPAKGDLSFRKALKSALDKQAEVLPEPAEPMEGVNSKTTALQECIDVEAGEPDVDKGWGESEAMSGDDVFSDEEPFLEQDMMVPDASWIMPTTGNSPSTIASPATAAPPAPPSEVMQQLVSAMAAEGWVGADIHGRKVVMLNVQCPGRGSVRIRLRKEDAGVSVRVRADNDELSSLLQTHHEQLRDSMARKGLALTNLEVVR